MSHMQPLTSSLLKQVKHTVRNHPLSTLAVGMGTAILVPIVLPLMKPLTKAAIKSGVSFYEKTKGAIAETGEVIGDIVAEAKAEVATEQAKKLSAAAGLIATPNNSQDSQDN